MGPQVLQVTLLSVENDLNDHMTAGFYFEVSSEPTAGQPKISRIHRSNDPVVDLNDEMLELDWFGDEQEVIIHLLSVKGSKQSEDGLEAELRIPYSAVRRYAEEAKGNNRDEKDGCRRFVMSRPEEMVKLNRKRRFQDMLLPSGRFFEGITKNFLTSVGNEHGLEVPSTEEMERLRSENEALRSEHHGLRLQAEATGASVQGSAPFSPVANDHLDEAPVVAIRFRLVPKSHMSHMAEEEFIKAEFQSSDDED